MIYPPPRTPLTHITPWYQGLRVRNTGGASKGTACLRAPVPTNRARDAREFVLWGEGRVGKRILRRGKCEWVVVCKWAARESERDSNVLSSFYSRFMPRTLSCARFYTCKFNIHTHCTIQYLRSLSPPSPFFPAPF